MATINPTPPTLVPAPVPALHIPSAKPAPFFDAALVHLLSSTRTAAEAQELCAHLLSSYNTNQPTSTSGTSTSQTFPPSRCPAIGSSSATLNLSSERANVPRINSNLILNDTGDFVETKDTSRAHRRSSLKVDSHDLEDSVMDLKETMHFVEITSQEKKNVFQLPAVRRNMRRLQYASWLMDSTILELSHKYMEVGPARASLMQIGYEALQDSCPEKSYHEELKFTSPAWGIAGNVSHSVCAARRIIKMCLDIRTPCMLCSRHPPLFMGAAATLASLVG